MDGLFQRLGHPFAGERADRGRAPAGIVVGLIAHILAVTVDRERHSQIAQAQEARKDGTQVLVARMNKNKKFQKEQLNKEGYEEFVEFYKEELKR